MTLLIFLISQFVFNLFSQNLFLETIAKKPLSEQVTILKKRIELEAKSTEVSISPAILDHYLKIAPVSEGPIDFLLSLVDSTEGATQLSIINSIVRNCPATHCLENTKIFETIRSHQDFQRQASLLVRGISLNNVETLLNDKDQLVEFLRSTYKESSTDYELQEVLIGKFIELGFYKEAMLILKEKPSASRPNQLLNYCILKLYTNKDDQFEECFKQLNSDIARLFFFHLKVITGEAIDNLELDRFINSISNRADKLRAAAIELKIHAKRSTSQSDLKWLELYLSENLDYKHTFILLSFYKDKMSPSLDDLKNRYVEKYPNHILTNVLTGKTKAEELYEYFGKYSLLYQSAKTTEKNAGVTN